MKDNKFTMDTASLSGMDKMDALTQRAIFCLGGAMVLNKKSFTREEVVEFLHEDNRWAPLANDSERVETVVKAIVPEDN